MMAATGRKGNILIIQKALNIKRNLLSMFFISAISLAKIVYFDSFSRNNFWMYFKSLLLPIWYSESGTRLWYSAGTHLNCLFFPNWFLFCPANVPSVSVIYINYRKIFECWCHNNDIKWDLALWIIYMIVQLEYIQISEWVKSICIFW